ncbi:hypothetical protein GCM10011374_35690 [Kocuria dechangensis]|uniref:Uncharacterized protein n=1 Tax=Kocuria dechangensis TaxID=1176249 RepID=A0A917H5D8_9MICC|nr:hypothetical protein [Kocuria dechangensis]GGG68212.1 hypothetical protein GCM10011374_35690 [Kocuria dechangensis]
MTTTEQATAAQNDLPTLPAASLLAARNWQAETTTGLTDGTQTTTTTLYASTVDAAAIRRIFGRPWDTPVAIWWEETPEASRLVVQVRTEKVTYDGHQDLPAALAELFAEIDADVADFDADTAPAQAPAEGIERALAAHRAVHQKTLAAQQEAAALAKVSTLSALSLIATTNPQVVSAEIALTGEDTFGQCLGSLKLTGTDGEPVALVSVGDTCLFDDLDRVAMEEIPEVEIGHRFEDETGYVIDLAAFRTAHA